MMHLSNTTHTQSLSLSLSLPSSRFRPISLGRAAFLAGLTFLALLLSPASAHALLVGDDGLIEPIIVQIKDSLRTSVDLDAKLAALASVEKENGLNEVEWYAGPKLLVKLSFPKEITDDEAQKAISALQASESVEKVVVQSAANLEFKPADFERSWKPDEVIPEAARRGFDVDRLKRPPIIYDEKTELPLHVANRVIVRWKDEYVWNGEQRGLEQQLAAFNAQAECEVVEERQYTDHDLTQILEFDAVKYSVLDQLLFYQANDMVDYVQPDYLYETQTVPNDPIYASQQWSLPKINAPSAWSIATGSDSVVVAVADTGANVNHPDFAPNLNTNYYNFVDENTNVTDNSGHGSNVASIVGAQGNNGIYMSGVSWNVSLMHLKIFPLVGGAATSDVVAAIDHARTHGASAINCSFGSYFCLRRINPDTGEFECYQYLLDPDIKAAIVRARGSMVVVCAAGNGINGVGQNNDMGNPFGPANVPTDNLLSVANSDANDARYPSSNFGVKTVDLAAPGAGIYGLSNDLSNYSVFYGTSQAAPHVTGTIALLKAKYGWENDHGLRDRVLMGTDDLTAWTTLDRTGGRLNAAKALHARTLIRNISTRARVENGDKIMIGGFIIGGSGTGTLKIAIRGLGPSLPGLSVAKLPNPKITLKKSDGTVVYSNDNWGTLPQAQKDDLGSLTPTNSLEAAMVQTLAPGAYSVFLESSNGTSFGVGLFEIFELENGADEQTRLLNVSTRCLVRTGEEKAIAGMIFGDTAQSTNTTIPKRSALMFGKGPSLPLTGKLANPLLTLYNSIGTLMSSNDSWSSATASVVKAADSSWSNKAAAVDEITEAGLSPTSSLESALWPILKSGIYTAELSGVSSGTGVGLIEIYEY